MQRTLSEEKTFRPRENLFLSEQHDMSLRRIFRPSPRRRKNRLMETVVNSTQIRALSMEVLFALEQGFDCEFSGEATDKFNTVGHAIHDLMESDQRRTTKISLADSANNFWLKPVKFS